MENIQQGTAPVVIVQEPKKSGCTECCECMLCCANCVIITDGITRICCCLCELVQCCAGLAK